MVCDLLCESFRKGFSEKQEVAAIDVDLDNGKISLTLMMVLV